MIEWGTYPIQRTITGTLETIQVRVKQAAISAPAVIIVGEVVNLRPRTAWFENKPLFGKRIIVTRLEERAGALSSKLEALGAAVSELPTICCLPLDDTPELDAALEDPHVFDWIVFTSATGVTSLMQHLERTKRGHALPDRAKSCSNRRSNG